MKTKRGYLAALSVLVVGALTPMASAQAAVDTSPPVWTKEPITSVAVGAPLVTNPDPDCGTSYLKTTVSWKAADAQSGIDHYAIGQNDEPESVGLATQATEYAYVDATICGGSGGDRQFYAVNGAGLSTSSFQWNGDRLTMRQDNDPKVTYRGSWSVSTCKCFSGGTTHKTSQAGASAASSSFSLGTNPKGYIIALSMPKASNRGKADIYVNGTLATTVDNHSTTNLNSTIVWRKTFAAGAKPTVKIVNRGTTRSDLDALVVIAK